MIKLVKTKEPEVLQKNSQNWTEVFLAKLERGENPIQAEKSKYRHKDIKAAILAETHGKCAYCESKLRHIHHGDVEHIYPKSLDESKRFLWSNLTLACEVCNQNKSDRDPKLEHIIDPYEVDPEEHILFVGCYAFPKGTVEGINTTTLLDLNRTELLERRKEKLDQIMSSYNTLLQSNIPIATKKVILENIEKNDGGDSSPYTAMVRSLIQQMASHIPHIRKGDVAI